MLVRSSDDLFQLPTIVYRVECAIRFWGEEGVIDMRELMIRNNIGNDAIRGIRQDNERRGGLELE